MPSNHALERTRPSRSLAIKGARGRVAQLGRLGGSVRSSAKISICTVGALVITVLGLLGSARSLLLTHSSQAPASLFFPFAMFAAYLDLASGYTMWFALALPQFFIYASFCAWAWVRGDDVKRVCTRIVVVHMLLGVGCAVLYGLER